MDQVTCVRFEGRNAFHTLPILRKRDKSALQTAMEDDIDLYQTSMVQAGEIIALPLTMATRGPRMAAR